MEVNGYCRKCQRSFDAHWHNYPKGYDMRPYCLTCKGYDVTWSTDESNDYGWGESQRCYEEED